MKFSYFNEGTNRLGLTSIARGITGFISTVSPSFSAFIGKHFLMRPYGKRSYSADYQTADRELKIQTSMGIAHINLFGQGSQVIIASHGWADSSESFTHLINSLTQRGYLVAAIDHIGHGKSTGKKSHLLSFIETMELLIEHFEQERTEIKGIVGHSMGAIATLNLPHQVLENKKIILISTPVRLFELMFEKVEQVGISRKLLKSVLGNIGNKYGRNWQHLSSENHKDKLNLDLTFIHDRGDKFAPFTDIEAYLKDEKPPLVVTSGLGHTRILGDTTVINNITQVLLT